MDCVVDLTSPRHFIPQTIPSNFLATLFIRAVASHAFDFYPDVLPT